MNKPRILLSCGAKAHNYENAVNGVGAIAVAKYLPEVDTSYDGLILCGGNDIDPSYYHEPIDGSVDIDAARDRAEFALLKAYLDAGKPVMGICRGFQLMNIYFGGSMHQHIPEHPIHSSGTASDCVHMVEALPDSLIRKLYGTSFYVNSSHHQALKALGEGIRPTAFWNNQYVEAFEHTSLPVIGFQFHPERMCFENQRPDTVDGADIFRHFVEMCRK